MAQKPVLDECPRCFDQGQVYLAGPLLREAITPIFRETWHIEDDLRSSAGVELLYCPNCGWFDTVADCNWDEWYEQFKQLLEVLRAMDKVLT